MRHIHISDVDGKTAICFDTGLDPRSFARTKMSQSLVEPGYIVALDGSKTVWKSTGVDDSRGLMMVWGAPFIGERLDLLLNAKLETQPRAALQTALQAIVYWIRAKMLLGETHSTLNPGAAFVVCADGADPNHSKGSVFFTPENLAQRCLLIEGLDMDHYNCPDLLGMDAVAFCAAAMLYRALTKTYPYPDNDNIYQDMREGVFVPPNLAAPGIDEKICSLINSALLLPVEGKKPSVSGTEILGDLLQILMHKDGGIAEISSLFRTLSAEENSQVIKETKYYKFKTDVTVKTKRFIINNKHALMIAGGIALFVLFVIISMARTRNNRLTTEGMEPDTVVHAYYDAFSSLNHTFMEECILGADKSDIDMATNFFVIAKVRQSNEMTRGLPIISARLWRENGGELPSPSAFGVTDLSLEHISGNDYEGMIQYRVNYLLWFPNEDEPSKRTDDLVLERKKGRWRITKIERTIHSAY